MSQFRTDPSSPKIDPPPTPATGPAGAVASASPASVAIPPSPASRTPANAPEDDPFLKLHKMSTTAGLGSADYVAINGNAIAAILLGIASAFVLMGTNLLLILPAAAIVCAILAFRQISDSNGTQTGNGLAVLGLVLALGFGGFFVGRETIVAVRNHADSQQIVTLIRDFADDIRASDYAKGYGLWDPRFQNRVSEAQFAARWERYGGMSIGKITNLDWTHLLEFDNNVVTGEREATGEVVVSFANIPGKDRQPMEFRKDTDGRWWFYDSPGLFPPNTPSRPGAGSAAGSSAASPVQGPPAPSRAR